VHCVIHTHTPAGMAVSAMKSGLMLITQTASRFHERIAYHDFEGPAVDTDEQARLVADLGPHNAMILRNHGLLTCGASVAQAFNLMYQLEMACRAQLGALSAGLDEVVVPGGAVLARSAHLFQPATHRAYGELEWHALMRMLDYEPGPYPSYKS
jgi:ribulose-5-phosphate 4-epimerase/fuculose-1-phosphate aldolase